MAKIGEITVPVNFAITENSKAVLKPLIAEIIREVLEEQKEEAMRAIRGAGYDPITQHYTVPFTEKD